MNKKQLILAVDDEQDILRLLNRILESAGYDVVLATNGALALELLEERKPDLVLLDIRMPELDGFQVLGLIRQRADVPVVMLSGRGDVMAVHDALGLGADDYIRKPFRTLEILARIKAKLRRVVPEPHLPPDQQQYRGNEYGLMGEDGGCLIGQVAQIHQGV